MKQFDADEFLLCSTVVATFWSQIYYSTTAKSKERIFFLYTLFMFVLHEVEDRTKWRAFGEIYVQLWTAIG